jgi:hypothetical protein
MLGMKLVTTRPARRAASVAVLIEEGHRHRARSSTCRAGRPLAASVVIMASPKAAWTSRRSPRRTPEKIIKTCARRTVRRPAAVPARELGFALGLDGRRSTSRRRSCWRSTALFIETDASLVEINPLIVTKDGDLLALDAKMNFDDNALFRHPTSPRCATSTRKIRSKSRSKFDLNYIKLDGNIGCMVNGAGLAMATMDIIKLGRRAGELPRRRRRRNARSRSPNAFKILILRQEREGDPRQHLRRHHALRRDRRGRHRRGQGGRRQGADGRAPGRHQRREGQEDAAESGLPIITADDMTTPRRRSSRKREERKPWRS